MQASGDQAKAEPLVLDSCGDDAECLLKCVVAGFFSCAARLQHDGSYRTVKDGRRVSIHPDSVISRFPTNIPAQWLIYNDVRLSTEEHIRDCSIINPMWLLDAAPHYYSARANQATQA